MGNLGFNERPYIELPARGFPIWSSGEWPRLRAMTVGYGHGIAVTPLHLATAYASSGLDLAAERTLASLVLTGVLFVHDLLAHCKRDPELDFCFCMDVTAVDYPGREKRFDVVYHFLSPTLNTRIRLRAHASETTQVPSLIDVFPGADWFEREAQGVPMLDLSNSDLGWVAITIQLIAGAIFIAAIVPGIVLGLLMLCALPFGKTVMLFDGVPRTRLTPFGETRTPGLADLFVATMKGTYA